VAFCVILVCSVATLLREYWRGPAVFFFFFFQNFYNFFAEQTYAVGPNGGGRRYFPSV